MSFVNFSKANCKNCYKCLRACPVKAIKFHHEQAEVVDERCIACGHCMIVCPQNARNIESDLEAVKEKLKNNSKVMVSVAPSFAGAFGEDSKALVSALKKLGFTRVEETAIGAYIVLHEYQQYIDTKPQSNYITTCCPSGNYLIETYFPSLIKYMLPVLSPMMTHGKILKSQYGEDVFTVFIGPCYAKKAEASEYCEHDHIDAVLTFEELAHWFQEEGIELDKLPKEEFDENSLLEGRRFPVIGGILDGLTVRDNMDKITVCGTEECMELFQAMEKGNVSNLCIELSACNESCIGGPAMPDNGFCSYTRRHWVKNYLNSKKDIVKPEVKLVTEDFNFYRSFRSKAIEPQQPSEDDIRKILKEMGKVVEADELNCGVCGYNTCREKAAAVYHGMAESTMCLHYMRTKAESLTNIIFESTPNIIIMLDEDLVVKEFNPAAEIAFKLKAEEVKNKSIENIFDPSDFVKVRDTKQDMLGLKVIYPQYDLVVLKSIIYLEKEQILLCTMLNIKSEEKNKEELQRVRENTLNVAQEVIDKQMRVAQEIASLLGETTAETKMILTKLKKITAGEDGEIR